MRFFIIGFLFFSFGLKAQTGGCKSGHFHKTSRANSAALDPRSDTIDIRHFTINLDMSNFPLQVIYGVCEVDFAALMNDVSTITLDLKALTVDSVTIDGNLANYSHVEEKINIQLPATLQAGDEKSLIVHYHGTPVEDVSGFGGFTYSGNYAFNIGVAFQDDPHNYGRVWFPCFDNFVERSTYTVIVKTPSSVKGYCGGLLMNEEVVDNFRTCTWQLNQEIPSYLASVAVSNYREVNYTFESILNPALNVKLVAAAGDTTPMKSAFVSLEPIFHRFESNWGPYRWDRIGYVSIPFNAGAMEHATNIGYPRALLSSGAAGNQHVMAHELSHHWFGDLATCRTASEMWLNEGFATYNEYMFDEWLISRAEYDKNIRSNHRAQLQLAHVVDNGYWPLSNVPHEFTYSNHTYPVPADKIHTLRSYMGDSAFFHGIKHYLDIHTFDDVTSSDLRDALEESSGLDLHDFFIDWVDTPGWPQFSVDSVQLMPSGNIIVKVYFRQKSRGNEHTFHNVPFEVSFRGSDFQLETRQIVLNGPIDSAFFTLPFEPVVTYINRNEKISHAVTAEERFIKSTGNVSWANALIEINTASVSDSVFLRVEHNWVNADSIKQPFSLYRISPERYWKVDGILKPGFKASGRFVFNGKTNSTSGGWLDNQLVTDESNVYLLFRTNTGSDWQVVNATKNAVGSPTDKYGNFLVDSLMLGEYAFGSLDSSLSIKDIAGPKALMKVYPNPAQDFVTIEWNLETAVATVELTDLNGKLLGLIPVTGKTDCKVPVSHLPAGQYFLTTTDKRGKKSSIPFVHD